MKCRKGDLAFLTVGDESGIVIQCVSFVGSIPRIKNHSDLWQVDKELAWYTKDGEKELVAMCPDKYLIPIRDSGEEDEMLRLIGYPNETVKFK